MKHPLHASNGLQAVFDFRRTHNSVGEVSQVEEIGEHEVVGGDVDAGNDSPAITGVEPMGGAMRH